MSEQNPIRTTRTLIQDLPADSNELSDLSPQELEAIAGGGIAFFNTNLVLVQPGGEACTSTAENQTCDVDYC